MQVLHGWLFGLLPRPVKRRLAEAWKARYANTTALPGKVLHRVLKQQQHRSWWRRKQHQTNTTTKLKADNTGANASLACSTTSAAGAGTEPAGSVSLQQQEASSSEKGHAASRLVPVQGHSSSQAGPGPHPHEGFHTAAARSSSAAADSAADVAQQHDQQVSIIIPPASAVTPGFATADTMRRRRSHSLGPAETSEALSAAAATPTAGMQAGGPVVAGQKQQHAEGEGWLTAAEVLSQQQQRVLHGEWRRAAAALAGGVSLQVRGVLGPWSGMH